MFRATFGIAGERRSAKSKGGEWAVVEVRFGFMGGVVAEANIADVGIGNVGNVVFVRRNGHGHCK